MEPYKVVFKKSVAQDLKGIPKRDVKRILEAIQTLAPAPGKKLSGQERYRLRQGKHRILYAIEDDKLIITVVRIGHRRDIYRK